MSSLRIPEFHSGSIKMYVIGAGGMLGKFLVPYFTSRGHDVMATDIDVNEQWLSFRDVRDFKGLQLDVESFKPEVIMNLAAMTDLEECERKSVEAIDTNYNGSYHCAKLTRELGIPYVYISTAGIFDGRKDSYYDWDLPNPICIYAKSKYWGERIAEYNPLHIVLRCGWQMGSCAKDKKFVGKIMKQLKAGATELNVVTDKLGTPTYVKDFTLQIERMLESRSYGIYNAVCKGSASRYDVSHELVHILGLQDKIKINVVGSDFWAKEYSAPRPASEKLITAKLDMLGLNVMRPWQVALAEYVSENPNFFRTEQ